MKIIFHTDTIQDSQAEPQSFQHFPKKAWFTCSLYFGFFLGRIHCTFVECSKAPYADVTFKVVDKLIATKTVF